MINPFTKSNKFACGFSAKINQWNGSHLVDSVSKAFGEENAIDLAFNGCEWKAEIALAPAGTDNYDLTAKFRLVKGDSAQTNIGISLELEDWSKENYVVMPSAAYNGNRFKSRKMPYAPLLNQPEDKGPNTPVVISDIPRLNIDDGPSGIYQLTGDFSTPSLGFYNDASHTGFWLLTDQETRLGNTGIAIDESLDRKKAAISLFAPGVRQDRRYTICNMDHACADRGHDFTQGETVEIRARLYIFDCRRIQQLFDRFPEIRKDLTGDPILVNSIPFSHAWTIQEEKYNSSNWIEKYGYYSVGLGEGINNDWQSGWIGGMMVTHALLLEGTQQTRERALRNFDFIFSGGQGKTGFFKAYHHEGQWYPDNLRDGDNNWTLVRRSADMLYFMLKQFMYIEKFGETVKKTWAEGVKRCAMGFVSQWETYHQMGQLIDSETGEIFVGGSASAAIAPAGLALAAQYFGEKKFLETAEALAQYYYENFTVKGYSNGAPVETALCPESESAFGLLESYVVLYEITGKASWLEKAQEQANQCFTWCVSYDYHFPASSTFGQLDMHTAGSVWGNTQNKHSAPGIASLSGDSIFKLYRATGNEQYLKLIQEIAHNLPQYLSREDRPIAARNFNINKGDGSIKNMPAGWMNERVEMSDWLEPVGEIFYGSCWCEVTNMLNYAEIPGIYVLTDTGQVTVFDHVEAEVVKKTGQGLELKITNKTPYDAQVKIFAESSQERAKILGPWLHDACKVVSVPSNGSVSVAL